VNWESPERGEWTGAAGGILWVSLLGRVGDRGGNPALAGRSLRPGGMILGGFFGFQPLFDCILGETRL
jgi:hypothetical protein